MLFVHMLVIILSERIFANCGTRFSSRRGSGHLCCIETLCNPQLRDVCALYEGPPMPTS